MITQTQIRNARKILCPEDHRLASPIADSRERFGALIGATGATIRRLENDAKYQPGRMLAMLLEREIARAERKKAKP